MKSCIFTALYFFKLDEINIDLPKLVNHCHKLNLRNKKFLRTDDDGDTDMYWKTT